MSSKMDPADGAPLDGNSKKVPASPELMGIIERAARRYGRTRPDARHIQSQPSPYATLFPAEILTVPFDDGPPLRLFVKYIGTEQEDHPDKQHRDRERCIYSTLFQDADLPVPAFYGAYRNQETGRMLLFLEYIDGWPLRLHALNRWADAAHWLALLHGHFARRPDLLRDAPCLLHFDASYFDSWAERARRATARVSSTLRHRLDRALQFQDAATNLLVQTPRTLVHHDLSPKNVVVAHENGAKPIRFVDWEQAGLGCGLLDLVHLTYGLDAEDARRIQHAYFEAAGTVSWIPAAEHGRAAVLAAAAWQGAVYRMARSDAWSVPPELIAEWITEIEACHPAISSAA